ncbi:hypothetical protein Dimus_002752 [Dionaea muscipula]
MALFYAPDYWLACTQSSWRLLQNIKQASKKHFGTQTHNLERGGMNKHAFGPLLLVNSFSQSSTSKLSRYGTLVQNLLHKGRLMWFTLNVYRSVTARSNF